MPLIGGVLVLESSYKKPGRHVLTNEERERGLRNIGSGSQVKNDEIKVREREENLIAQGKGHLVDIAEKVPTKKEKYLIPIRENYKRARLGSIPQLDIDTGIKTYSRPAIPKPVEEKPKFIKSLFGKQEYVKPTQRLIKPTNIIQVRKPSPIVKRTSQSLFSGTFETQKSVCPLKSNKIDCMGLNMFKQPTGIKKAIKSTPKVVLKQRSGLFSGTFMSPKKSHKIVKKKKQVCYTKVKRHFRFI